MVEVVGGKFSLACVLLGCVVLLGYFSDMVCPSSFSTRPTASFKISCPVYSGPPVGLVLVLCVRRVAELCCALETSRNGSTNERSNPVVIDSIDGILTLNVRKKKTIHRPAQQLSGRQQQHEP